MTQPSSQTDKSRAFKEVPTPLKLFFFPVLVFVLIPAWIVQDLLLPDPSLGLIMIVFFLLFSAGMSFLLVLGGEFSAYKRFKRSSSIAEAEVLRRYSIHDSDDLVSRTDHYLELKFTIADPSGDAQEIKGILWIGQSFSRKKRMFSTTRKGSKIKIQYSTEDPYLISVVSA